MKRGMIWLLLLAMLAQLALPAAAVETPAEDGAAVSAEDPSEGPAAEEETAGTPTEETGETVESQDPQPEEEPAAPEEDPAGDTGTDEDGAQEETPDAPAPEEDPAPAPEETPDEPASEETPDEPALEETPDEPAQEELPASEDEAEDGERLYAGQEADYNDPEFLKLLEEGYFDGDFGMTASYSMASSNGWGSTHSSRFEGYEIQDGIDISKWNKANAIGTQDIVWSRVAQDVDFAIIRCAYRGVRDGALHKDVSFDTNMRGALNAGLEVGIYVFSQAITEEEARAEARYALQLAKGYSFTLPIVIDYEYSEGGRLTSGGLSDAKRTSICLAFCEVIEEAGYPTMLYANRSMLVDDMNGQKIADSGYEVWLAEWRGATTYSGTYTYWQYSDRGSISGIYGGVDLDYRYVLPEADIEYVFCTRQGVRLRWNTVSAADSYRIYRQTSGSDQWTLLTTVKGSGSGLYLDTSAVEGVTYRYRVQACDGAVRAQMDEAGTQVTYLPQLSLSAAVNEEKGVQLTWEADTGCDSYQVLRRTKETESWTVIASIADTSQTSYVDTSAAAGKSGVTYYYSIRGVSNGQPAAQFDEYGLEIYWLALTKLTSAAAHRSGMQVKWEPVAGAEQYFVYRKQDGKWVKIATVKGESSKYYVDTAVESGKTYTYTVRGYTGSTYGSFSRTGVTGTYLAMPKLNALTENGGKVRLTWSAEQNATSYLVYRKRASGAWVRVATVTEGLSYQETLPDYGLYHYTVRAARGNVLSWYDESGLETCYLSTPKLKGTSAASNGVTVTWSAVEGATGYYLYRKENSAWKYRGSTTSTSYTDKTADLTGTETYTVRAYWGSKLSDYSRTGITWRYVPAPKMLGAANSNGKGILVRWQTVADAERYYVYRKSTGGWTRIATLGAVDNYLDTSLESGVRYTYTVRAEVKGSLGGYESAGVSYRYLSIPELKSPAYHDRGVTVSWQAVPGAASYRVYRRQGTGWEAIANTSATSYLDTAATTVGQTYRYTVRAIKDNCSSFYDTAGVSFLRLATPALSSLTNCEDGLSLSWKKVSGAQQYYIYRKTGSTGWARVAIVGDVGSYVDSSAVSGTSYAYTVRAAASKQLCSGYDTKGLTCLRLGTPVLSGAASVTGGLQVTWKAVSGAQEYQVYRRQEGGSWEKVSTVKTCQFLDTGVRGGATYHYTVSAASGTASGCYDSEGVSCAYLATPRLLDLLNSGNGLELSWEEVDGAQSYYVYRKTAGSNWTRIATVEGTGRYLDTTCVSGTSYSYTVRAYGGALSGYDRSGLTTLFEAYDETVS